MSEKQKADSLSKDLAEMMGGLTKGWKREKKRTDKTERLSRSGWGRMYNYSDRVTIKSVAFKYMEQAYNKASGNGKYWANARQIFYAARPLILAEATRETVDSVYFTQTLLKDYLEEHSPSWKVVWDARGHFHEPHTDHEIGVGGLDVMDYIGKWKGNTVADTEIPEIEMLLKTKGPQNRFSSVLFIEKEGFDELLKESKFGEKYDMAVMSTKGVPNKACCDLLCRLVTKGVQVFALHDFDVAGFVIINTLRTGARLSHGVAVTDLGLRLGDIEGLDSEPCDRGDIKNDTLRSCGCTEEEIEFFQRGERVELNAMTSEQFIEWLGKKLEARGIKKVIPGEDVLDDTYRRAYFAASIEEKLEDLERETEEEVEGMKEHGKLRAKVKKGLAEDPDSTWDKIVWDMAHDHFKDEDDDDEDEETGDK